MPPEALRLRGPVGRLDVALAAAATAGGVWLMVMNVTDAPDGIHVSPLAAVGILAFTFPLLWRSSAPLAALAACLLAMAAHLLVFGTVVRCGVVYPVTWLLAYAAGARLDRDEAGLALALAVVTQWVMGLDDGAITVGVTLVLSPITAGVWSAGRVAHRRGQLVAELEERTAELRRARDERARLEVATDRARLSAELDAVLRDRVARIAGLAGTGEAEADPEAARAVLVQIESAARRTLDEMRAVVGVLRTDGPAPTAPLPTLVHLDTLLQRARGAGARLRVEGSPRVLPVGVELSAYRAVEHLLAALADAGDVEVVVRFGDDALEIVIAGPARPARRAEDAIERARERVELHAGTLVASTRGGRAEAVVHLPVAVGA